MEKKDLTTTIYNIPPELYLKISQETLSRIGSSSYFSGVIQFEAEDGVECRFLLSCVVYRRRELLPEGESSRIYSIVPVWWEFHTYLPDKEIMNDFSFRELQFENIND